MKRKQVIRLNESQLHDIVMESVANVLSEFKDWRAQLLHSAAKNDYAGMAKADRMASDKYDTEAHFDKQSGYHTLGCDDAGPGMTFHGYDDLAKPKRNGRNIDQLRKEMGDYYIGDYKKRLKQKAGKLGNAKSGQDFTPNALR